MPRGLLSDTNYLGAFVRPNDFAGYRGAGVLLLKTGERKGQTLALVGCEKRWNEPQFSGRSSDEPMVGRYFLKIFIFHERDS